MEITTSTGGHDPSFVPEACTLPTAEQPLRVAEFADLFASAIRTVTRNSPNRLTLVLDDDPATEASARDLTARENHCCSFFTFTFGRVAPAQPATGLKLVITVPAGHVAVFDGLQRLAETAHRGEEPA